MGYTDATETQLKLLADALRAYVSDAGARINDYKATVYIDFAVQDAALPYILITKGEGSTDPEVHDLREDFDLLVTIRGRSRADTSIVRALADLCEQALLAFRSSGTDHGLTSVKSVRREGIIDFAANPTTDEEIELELIAECFSWPMRQIDALT